MTRLLSVIGVSAGLLLAGCGADPGSLASATSSTSSEAPTSAPSITTANPGLASSTSSTKHTTARATHPAPTRSATSHPSVRRTPKPAPTHVSPLVVHPGAFCSPAGARGVTSKGTLMECKTTSKDRRLRWRSA
jgi:hypothetical protein